MNYYVYQLRLSTSELPFYIGKGKDSRCHVHLRPSSLRGRSRKNSIIKKAMSEGVDVLVEIIHADLSEENASNIEVSEIARYGRVEDGGILANHTKGGEGRSGFSPSAETRAKISAGNTGKKRTPEMSAAMSERRKGRKRTDIHAGQIGDWARGRKKSPETIAKMSAAKTGKTQTEEHTKAMKFGRWDNDPNWLKADAIYDAWVSLGRPGKTKLSRVVPGLERSTIQTRFAQGWIPAEDSEWLEYKASRPVQQAD